MIRAPLVNSVLGAARTTRQLLLRRNAFDDAVGLAITQPRVPSASSSQPPASAPAPRSDALELRALSSCPLWFSACLRAKNALTRALEAADRDSVEAHLTRFGALLRLGRVLNSLGALGPSINFVEKRLHKWYDQALKDGISRGLIVPGTTSGVHAKKMLSVRVEPATAELMSKEATQRQKYEATLQRGLAGQGYLHFDDEDLTGLSMPMRSVWAAAVGSAAVWRAKKYRVPVGHDAMNRIMPFCQNAATREKMFEAYFANFHGEVDSAALDLLRARQELAERLGFRNWAEYELKPLVVGDPATAQQFLDGFWRDAEPALKPVLRRMEELAFASSGAPATRNDRSKSKLRQCDAAFLRAVVNREADTWELAKFLPADKSLPRILEVVGRAYNVDFHEVQKPELAERLLNGWHRSVRIYEVIDGPPRSGAVGVEAQQRRLGFVYLDMFARISLLGRASVQLAGAAMVCPGHAYVSMNLMPAGMGSMKLLNPEEMLAMAHELGHAVHMLCHQGSAQDFDDLPLDVAELPSTLVETIALQPSVVSQYARHHSTGGPPPDALVKSCQRDAQFYVRSLQSANVVLGLHGDGFDPHSATPEDLRAKAVSLWQRYSPIEAHPGFTPLGEDPGLHIGQGANHIAYLLCYMRVDAILHGQQQGAPARGKASVERWQNQDFAGRVRSQLLDRNYPGQRLATLLPPLTMSSDSAALDKKPNIVRPLPHPFPSPPSTGASLLSRALA